MATRAYIITAQNLDLDSLKKDLHTKNKPAVYVRCDGFPAHVLPILADIYTANPSGKNIALSLRPFVPPSFPVAYSHPFGEYDNTSYIYIITPDMLYCYNGDLTQHVASIPRNASGKALVTIYEAFRDYCETSDLDGTAWIQTVTTDKITFYFNPNVSLHIPVEAYLGDFLHLFNPDLVMEAIPYE